MRWLSRAFWLSAWSLWLWLGFGLYRELPRERPAISDLAPGRDGMYFGFVGDSHRLLVLTQDGADRSSIHVLDAESGALVLRAEGPASAVMSCASPAALRHGVLLANRKMHGSERETVHVFDIEAGQWRMLTHRRGYEIGVHRERPWAIFNSPPEPGQPGDAYRVIAMDFRTGRELFARDLALSATFYRNPFFLADDRLVTQWSESRHDANKRRLARGEAIVEAPAGADPFFNHRLEIWRLANPPAIVKSADDVCVGEIASVSADGRVAFSFAFAEPHDGVFDPGEARIIFAAPYHDQDFDSRYTGRLIAPGLSRSGRRVLASSPPTLRDVNGRQLRWRPIHPAIEAWSASGDRFVVVESWDAVWRRWLPTLRFKTLALRDLETGNLLYRMAWDGAWLPPHAICDDGVFAVANGGTLYRLPSSVNYPLLALCQTILALPLLLLWAGLRWRRKRRTTVGDFKAACA